VEDLGSTSRTNLLHAIEQREEEEASRVLASLCDRRDGDAHRRGLLSPLIDWMRDLLSSSGSSSIEQEKHCFPF
jgi:hypothetical protein